MTKQDKYIRKIAKKVYVDGMLFKSAKSAARFICSLEPEKKIETVSKEIKRCLNGVRPEWKMYGKYMIEKSK